jgi:hypothetical protein
MRDLRHVDKFAFVGNSLYYEPFEIRHTLCQEYIQTLTDICKMHDWNMLREGLWMYATPKNTTKLPHQGWKIHVSATLKNAKHILVNVAKILIPKGVSFKFIMDSKVHTMTNLKNFHRGSSGKFITIYPRDDEEFREVINTLHETLKNEEGPYTLR